MAWAIGATGASISIIGFAELMRLIHSQFLNKKIDTILRRLPAPECQVPPRTQRDHEATPPAAAKAIRDTSDVSVTLDLLPESSWYRISRMLRLGHIVAGVNYRLAVKIRNQTGRVLNDILVASQVGILTSTGQIQFQTAISIPRLDAAQEKTVISPNQFLMRQIGTADLAVTSISSGGQNLLILYQGQPNQTYLTSYESEARKAISDRAIGIVDLIFASGFIAIVLKVYLQIG